MIKIIQRYCFKNLQRKQEKILEEAKEILKDAAYIDMCIYYKILP